MKRKRGEMGVRRRIYALVIAMATILSLVCVPQMEAEAAPAAYLEMTAVDGGAVPLEIGDTVSLKIAFTAAAAAYTDIYEIAAQLVMDTSCFQVEGIVAEAGWTASCSDSQVGIISSSVTGGSGTGALATLTLRVKKSVESTTQIQMTNVRVWCVNTTAPDCLPVSCTLTNSMSGSRSVVFAVPASFDVPLVVGEKGRVPISITSNTGFNILHLKVRYLSSLLIYDGFELSAEARSGQMSLTTISITADGAYNELSLCFVAQNDIRMTGEFVYIDFTPNLAGSASVSVTGASVTPLVYDIRNESETTMSAPAITPTVIRFTNDTVLLGDINGDTYINLVDAAWALQAYNGVRVLTEEQLNRADVNRSGSLTLVDALLIMKLYNGEITQFPIP